MTLEELLKALVETEDQMARMELVEANQELLNSTSEESSEDAVEDWQAKYNELRKKYIDTFFSGTKNEESTEENTDTVDDETAKAETISVDDLLKGDK